MKAQVAPETAGRQARLEELYERNAPSALKTAYFLTGDPDLAEDLVQEAFVRVAGRFDGASSAFTTCSGPSSSHPPTS